MIASVSEGCFLLQSRHSDAAASFWVDLCSCHFVLFLLEAESLAPESWLVRKSNP